MTEAGVFFLLDEKTSTMIILTVIIKDKPTRVFSKATRNAPPTKGKISPAPVGIWTRRRRKSQSQKKSMKQPNAVTMPLNSSIIC